jgi:putative tributyrin esterase
MKSYPSRSFLVRLTAKWALVVLSLLLGTSAFSQTTPLTVNCTSVPSAILARDVSVCVALPADYESSAPQRFPALYYLHGLFEDPHRWVERGGKAILEDLLSRHEVGEFIVVLPDGGRTFYVNSFDGRDRYEDFFVQELVPWIDQHYRTIASRAARGLSGSSMGGYGALHIGMRHADLFGSVSAQSAALLPKFPDPLPTEGRWGFYARVLQGPFGSPLSEKYWEENNPLTLAEQPDKFSGLKLYFDCGDQDRYGFNEGAELLDKILTSKGFAHDFTLRSGGHGWDYLNLYMKFPLKFHWQVFEAAEKALAGKETGLKNSGGSK